jgi:hypothetical protein
VPFQKQADLAPKSRFCDALSRGQPSKGLETGLDDGKNADATIWQCQNRKVLDSLPKTYFGGSGARSEGCDEDPSINCSDDNGTRNPRHPGVYEQCVQEQPAWLVRFHHSTPNENWLSSGSTMARRVLAEGCPRRFYNFGYSVWRVLPTRDEAQRIAANAAKLPPATSLVGVNPLTLDCPLFKDYLLWHSPVWFGILYKPLILARARTLGIVRRLFLYQLQSWTAPARG